MVLLLLLQLMKVMPFPLPRVVVWIMITKSSHFQPITDLAQAPADPPLAPHHMLPQQLLLPVTAMP